MIADSLVYVHQVFASTALTSVMSHFDSSLTLGERGHAADRLATATLLTFVQATAGFSALAQLPSLNRLTVSATASSGPVGCRCPLRFTPYFNRRMCEKKGASRSLHPSNGHFVNLMSAVIKIRPPLN